MTGENRSLNTMRTVAALLVVVSHLRALLFVDYDQSSGSPIAAVFYALTGLGHEAVLVFFVLSGYWVGGAVLRDVAARTFDWANYAVSRLVRLWLVLLPALLLTAVADFVGRAAFQSADIYAGSDAYHSVVPDDLGAVDGPGVALANAVFLQGVRTSTFGTNTPLWSLAYEFWYYMLFPALLVIVVGSARRKVAALIIAVVCAVVMGPDALLLFTTWLIGAAVAWRRESLQALVGRVRHLGWLQAATTALVLIVMCGVAAASPPRIVGALAIAVTTAACLGTLIDDVSPRVARLAALHGASWLADRSFSLYAIHVPLLALATAAIGVAADDRWRLSVASFAAAVLITAAVTAAAVAFAQVTEMQTGPVRRAIRARLQLDKTRATDRGA